MNKEKWRNNEVTHNDLKTWIYVNYTTSRITYGISLAHHTFSGLRARAQLKNMNKISEI